MKLNETGFTLIEITIVSALLSIIVVALLAVTTYSQAIFQDHNSYSTVTHNASQTLRSISREIGQTSPNATPSHLSISTDGNNNSVVAFQIPVDWDNDGDAVTGTLNPQVEWGAYSFPGYTSNGRLNDWAVYYVNGNNQLVREVRVGAVGGAVDASTQQVVANSVQSFTTTQTGDNLQMVLTLQMIDQIGQRGGARTHTQTFTSDTLLRNAVN